MSARVQPGAAKCAATHAEQQNYPALPGECSLAKSWIGNNVSPCMLSHCKPEPDRYRCSNQSGRAE